jgi:hypothetical protein
MIVDLSTTLAWGYLKSFRKAMAIVNMQKIRGKPRLTSGECSIAFNDFVLQFIFGAIKWVRGDRNLDLV